MQKSPHLQLWQASLLGIVQGLTEFLPVSSTAHLNLINRICHWHRPGLVLDTSLHLGTLLATLVWTSQEQIQGDLLHFALVAKVAVATLPAGLAGLALDSYIDAHWRSPQVTAAMLMLGGALLWWVEQQALQARELDDLSWADALWIGLAQALALVPGLSRSGMTVGAGLARGFKRPAALRFSFLQSIPIVAASGGYKLWQWHRSRNPVEAAPLLIGSGTAALSGYLCLEGMLHLFRQRSLKGFALYRLLLGTALLFFNHRSSKKVTRLL